MMGRGRRPVETVPSHGVQIVASLTHNNNMNFNFFEFLFLWFIELSGLEI